MPEIEHIVVVMKENHSFDDSTSACSGRGDGFKLDAQRPAGRREPGRQRQIREGVPHAVEVPVARAPRAELGDVATTRGTAARTTGSSRGERSGVDGVLGRDRSAVLLRPREDVPAVRPLVLFGACADVSEPALPARRNCRRDREHDDERTHGFTAAERFDFRPARRAQDYVEGLLHRPSRFARVVVGSGKARSRTK